MMKSQKACCHLGKQAKLNVVSGDTVTAGDMLPAVYGPGPSRESICPLTRCWWTGAAACMPTHTHIQNNLLPSLQYSMVYPSRLESPMVSGVFHLMVRLESFTSSTDTASGALVGTIGSLNKQFMRDCNDYTYTLPFTLWLQIGLQLIIFLMT